MGIEQIPIMPKTKKPELVYNRLPEHNGFGSEEDSLSKKIIII